MCEIQTPLIKMCGNTTPHKKAWSLLTIYMQQKKFIFILRIVLTPFELSDLSESDTMKGQRNEPIR